MIGSGAVSRHPEFMTRPAWYLSACLCFAAGPTRAGDTAWQLHLDRRAVVGERCAVVASGQQDRRVVATTPSRAQEVTEEHLEVSYAATHEVKAVDGDGRAREVLITVERLVTNDGSGPQEQFPAGTQITASADGDQTRYRLGRDELQGTLSDALNLAGAKLPSAHEPSEDEVFLNHRARQPGERWRADPERLAIAIAATSAFIIDAAASTGEICLDGPAEEAGIAALATTTVYHIVPKAFRNAPPERPLKDSEVNSTAVRWFPLDPALPLLKETLKTTMKLSQRADSGTSGRGADTTFSREVTRRCLRLPPS